VALGAAALYLVNVGDYFIGDDFDLIRSFWGKPPLYFLELLFRNESGDVWKSWGIDPAEGLGFLRPLKIWLLALDLSVWGPRALGFHLTSTAFFVGMVVQVHRILLLLVPGRTPLAFAGALTLAIHPVFSEVVPFITAREETVAAFFGLWAFQRFLRLRLHGGSPLAFQVLYALALLTKESAIVVAGLASATSRGGTSSPRGTDRCRRTSGSTACSSARCCTPRSAPSATSSTSGSRPCCCSPPVSSPWRSVRPASAEHTCALCCSSARSVTWARLPCSSAPSSPCVATGCR
jgi:hypothetical protein